LPVDELDVDAWLDINEIICPEHNTRDCSMRKMRLIFMMLSAQIVAAIVWVLWLLMSA
jgi:hypothetical protein